MNIRPIFLVLVAFVFHFNSYSQIQANFTADTTSSCDQITITFTDLSTGSVTSWDWDFGNGNTSSVQNPSFTFTQKQSYTISLTVSDGTNSDIETKTNYISIYNKPIANYSSSIKEGCSPLTVEFTDNSTIGDGPIAIYSWDFGDGSSPGDSANPVHTYQTKSNPKYPVSLEIEDQNGCTDVVIVDSIIVTQSPEVKFSSYNRSDSCGAPYTVRFQNLTTGASNLTYEWEFGDGSPISTQFEPVHTYSAQGRYDVTLIASDPNCSDTLEQKSFVRLETTVADFTISKDTACIGDTLQFSNSSTNANLFSWRFGDGENSTDENPEHYFEEAGTYTVELIVSISGSNCISSIKKEVVIPELIAAFSVIDTFSCETSKKIRLDNQSIGADSAKWYLGNIFKASTPIYSRDYNSSFLSENERDTALFTLIVSNRFGCMDTASILDTFVNSRIVLTVGVENSDTINQWDSIPPNKIPIPFYGTCLPFDVKFGYGYSGPSELIKWKWNFGNDDSTIVEDPPYTSYTEEKIYTVTLTVEDDSGCVSTDMVQIYGDFDQPTIDFSITPEPDSVCNYERVYIKNQSPDSSTIESYSYNVLSSGEGASQKLALQDTLDRFYFDRLPDTGYFAIQQVGFNNGCPDTLTKGLQIYSLGPIIDKLGYTVGNCEDRTTVSFNSFVIDADGFEWDFGDSTPVNTTDTNPTHTYAGFTRFWAKFKTWNDGNRCDTIRDSLFIDLQTIPLDFYPEDRNICTGDTIQFEDVSVGTFEKYSWNFNGLEVDTTNRFKRVMKNQGLIEVILRVEDSFGCPDSLYDTLYVSRPKAKIGTRLIENCVPVEVEFFDDSETDTTINKWYWEFGVMDTSIQEKDTIIYETNGSKNAYLRVENIFGCADSIKEPAAIEILALDVTFLQGETKLCLGDSITFRNTSNGISPIFTWNFGDGTTLQSNLDTVGYRYQNAGTYSVGLKATDENGCELEILKDQLVTVDPSVLADFTSDTADADCYPLPVFFEDLSIGTIEKWEWQFGDESNSIFKNPFHSYIRPGSYDVSLKVTSPNGCSDSIFKANFININGPTAEFTISKNEACINEELTFTITNSSRVDNFNWDFGDNTIDSINPAKHIYNSTGDFIVFLNLSDTSEECKVNVTDTVSILDVFADFSINDDSACVPFIAEFSNQSMNETSILWKFNNGITSTDQNPSITYNNPGRYDISLSISSNEGCLDTAYKTIEVFPYPILQTTPDTGACIGDQIILTATGALNYQWRPSRFLNRTTGSQVISRPDTTITYTVSGQNIAGCESSSSIEVFVPQPPIRTALDDTSINIGETIDLDVTAGLRYKYIWSPSEGLDCPICPNPQAKPLKDQKYFVRIFDIFGCYSILDSIEIKVTEMYTLDVPKAFSPNGDGINDLLFPRGLGLKGGIKFKIYNRFGELVFESNDLNKGWDGTYKGKLQNIETYIYTIEATTYGERTLFKKGNISLLR